VILLGAVAIVCALIWVAFGLAFPTPGIIPARLILGPPMVVAGLGILTILGAVFFGERR
jgi:hypothetical protein